MDYTIKPGDNLSTIAKANNTTVGALASLNKLSNPNKIVAGQTLKLGVPTTNTNVANTAFNAPITQPQAVPPTINAGIIGTTPQVNVPTNAVQVQSFRDNPDGTTTNFLSNGQQSTVRYTKNADGSLTPVEVDNFAERQIIPEQPRTEAQRFEEKSIFDILQGTQELAGKSAFEAQQQDLAGVQAKQAEYKAISDKIRSRQAQLQQEYAAINQSPMSFAARSGYESAVRAAAESEIGALNAQAQAVAGDYEMAVQTAQRAVDAKYKPILEKLELQKAQLEAIKPLLARDEQKQAREMDYLLKQEERKYNEKIDKEKKASDLFINAQSQGAPQSVVSKAKAIFDKGGNIIDVANALGQYAGDYLGNAVKRASLAKTNAEIEKIRADIKSSTTLVNTANLPNTAAGFTTRLLSTAKSDKNLDASDRQSLAKNMTVINQLDSLQKNIGKVNTGFTSGKVASLMSKIGANKDAGVVQAQLQAIVPNLARGVYGEVGVLTDNDIANYRKTIPNLTSPEAQNDAVLALTLKTVKNAMENQLRSAANSGVNVSGWAEDFNRITKQVNEIEDRIGVSKTAVNEIVAQNPNLLPAVKELYSLGRTDREILEALNAQ